MTSLSDSQNIDLGGDGAPVLPPGSPLQICPGCEALLDTSEREPLEKITCPQCGAAMTVNGQIAHYQILEVAGRGGMGVVYKAYDPSLDRQVALKVLRTDHSLDPKLIQQLETEAAITASVNDPNVVRVYGTGVDRGRFYLAMELVDKGSLDSLINLQGRVAEAQVLQIGAQVARGLRAAQQLGLIHRDVKPGNILFSDSQTAKIVDFGLAIFEEQEESVRGEIWGTPYYVAPEKLDQQPEDFRSDMYSLGGTLFHALAGRPPFEAENASLVALKHLKSQQVSLQSFAPWVSNGTAHIINRMLNKDPGQRFQSYDELIDSFEYALTQLHNQSGVTTPRARVALETAEDQKRWTWVMLAMVGVLVVCGLGLFLFLGKGPVSVANKPVTAAVRTGARYEPLQKPIEALAAAKKEAADLFDEASANAALSPADRAWAQLFKGAALLVNGKNSEAHEAFGILDTMASQVKNKPMSELLEHIATRMRDNKPIPSAETAKLNTSGHEAATLLLYALHEWQGGRTEDAVALFKQFRGADPLGTAEWIGQFKPLAIDFIERQTAFQIAGDRLKAAATPAERSAAADSLKKLDRVFAARADKLIEPYKPEIAKYKVEIAKPPTSGVFRIASRLSGKVLDVGGRSLNPGAKVQTADGGSVLHQWWKLVSLGQDKVKLVAMHSGKLLTVEGDGTADNAKVVQADDKDLPTQKWLIVSKNDGWFKLRNEAAGRILAIEGDKRESGVALIVKADGDKGEWQWRFDRQATPVGEYFGTLLGGGKGGFEFKDGAYRIRNASRDIAGTSDNFGFAFREVTGDFELIARVVEITDPQANAKVGIIVRAGLGGDDASVALLTLSPSSGNPPKITTNGVSHLQRLKKGVAMTETKTPNLPLPRWLKLVRAGETITSFQSADGATWQQTGTATLEDLKKFAYAGLAVTSHNPEKESTAKFDQVKLTVVKK